VVGAAHPGAGGRKALCLETEGGPVYPADHTETVLLGSCRGTNTWVAKKGPSPFKEGGRERGPGRKAGRRGQASALLVRGPDHSDLSKWGKAGGYPAKVAGSEAGLVVRVLYSGGGSTIRKSRKKGIYRKGRRKLGGDYLSGSI